MVMNAPILSVLTFESQITGLIVLSILASVFLGRVPRLVIWLLAFFLVICLFPGDRIAASLGGIVAGVLGPVLTIGIVVLGLRMIVGAGRSNCSRCGYGSNDCHCDRRYF